METNDYLKRVREIKKEVLNEIEKVLSDYGCHDFKETFFVHYVDGDVATTETLKGADVCSDGHIGFWVRSMTEKDDFVEGDVLFYYDINSLIDILSNLKKEIREEKLQTLRELVKKAGGHISFDGNFKFDSVYEADQECYEGTELQGISVTGSGDFEMNLYHLGEYFELDGSGMPTYELDRIIEYVRKQTEKSPEERLALTDEQKNVVNKIKNEIAELQRLGGAIMLDNDHGTLFAVNVKDEEFILCGTVWAYQTRVDIAKLPQDGVIGDGYVCYSSEGIYLK